MCHPPTGLQSQISEDETSRSQECATSQDYLGASVLKRTKKTMPEIVICAVCSYVCTCVHI